MDKKFICIDYSGSTGNNNSYWVYVRNVLDKNHDDTSSIVFWDTNAKIVTKNEAIKQISSRQGYGGTSPSCLAKILPEKSIAAPIG